MHVNEWRASSGNSEVTLDQQTIEVCKEQLSALYTHMKLQHKARPKIL